MSMNCSVLCCRKKPKYELGDIKFCKDHKPKLFKNPRNKNNYTKLKLKKGFELYCDEDNYVLVKENKILYYGEKFKRLNLEELDRKIKEFKNNINNETKNNN